MKDHALELLASQALAVHIMTRHGSHGRHLERREASSQPTVGPSGGHTAINIVSEKDANLWHGLDG